MTGGRFTLVGTDLVRRPVGRVRIDIPKEKIAEFCRMHHIRKLALFGSVLREDFRPDSDVDVLVEFEPGHVVGLRLIQMEEELSQLLGGHKVDIVTSKFLNRRIRDRVLASAEVQYAEG
jgi:predicted nucleotidyltransferase